MRLMLTRLRFVFLLIPVLFGLGGCVYAGPGYYGGGYGGYYAGPAYYPQYYGPPAYGTVWIGGGGWGRRWR